MSVLIQAGGEVDPLRPGRMVDQRVAVSVALLDGLVAVLLVLAGRLCPVPPEQGWAAVRPRTPRWRQRPGSATGSTASPARRHLCPNLARTALARVDRSRAGQLARSRGSRSRGPRAALRLVRPNLRTDQE